MQIGVKGEKIQIKIKERNERETKDKRKSFLLNVTVQELT